MAWLFYTLLGIALFLMLAVLAVGRVAYGMTLIRRETKVTIQKKTEAEALRQNEIRTDMRAEGRAWIMAQNPEDVQMKSHDGLTLRAWYLPAAKPSEKLVVFSHGFRCNGLDEFGPFFQYYHEQLNYHILVPDHRSHGRSEGKKIGFAALEWRDIFDWADVFYKRLGAGTQIALHGMSMGAATVMNCNAHNPPGYIKCMIEDCGFSNGYEMMWLSARRDLKANFPPLMWAVAFWYRLGNGVSLKKESDPLGNADQFSKPMLFVHGVDDALVPCEMGVRCYEAAACPKELYLAEGCQHVMSYYLRKEEYEAKLGAWLERWMKEEVAA